MTDQFFINILTDKTGGLIGCFQEEKPKFLKQFYLSGGTGLALLTADLFAWAAMRMHKEVEWEKAKMEITAKVKSYPLKKG